MLAKCRADTHDYQKYVCDLSKSPRAGPTRRDFYFDFLSTRVSRPVASCLCLIELSSRFAA